MALAFRSAAAAADGAGPTSLTVSKPSGTADGDLLLAFVVIGGDQSITTVPSGWTLVDYQSTGPATGDCLHACYWKSASSEPASWVWGWSAGDDAAAVVLAYTGAAASPIDANAFNLMSGSVETMTSPSVTPTSSSVAVLAFGANPFYNGTTSFTLPNSTTSRGSADPGPGTTNRAVVHVYELSTTQATATGEKSTTLNNFAKGIAYSISLLPSGAVPQTVIIDSRAV